MAHRRGAENTIRFSSYFGVCGFRPALAATPLHLASWART